MTFHLDIQTRVIDETHRVMIARPGAKFRLHTIFHEKRFIGLELPGLFLDDEIIAYDERNIVSRVLRATEIKKWIGSGRSTDRPSLRLSSYDNKSNSGSIRQYLRLIRYYLRDIKEGDLILNPPGSFSGITYIGEYGLSKRSIESHYTDTYHDFPIIGVPVTWIGTMLKRDLPPRALEALRKPTALYEVGPKNRDKIYAAAYGNFVFEDRFTASFATISERYGTTDELILQAFFASVAMNTRSVDSKSKETAGLAEAAAIILTNGSIAFGDYALDLNININSPGLISILSEKVTPLVAASLFALAITAGPAAFAAVNNNTITVGNSTAPGDDKCTMAVRKQVYAQIKLLGWDRWTNACKRLNELKNETGVSSPANVTGKASDPSRRRQREAPPKK